VRAFVWATGIALAIMTAWGSLAQFAVAAPMLPLYPFSIFVVCLGVVQSISACRNR
jgi:Sec-independent protein secretion pathway component TatC